VNLHILGIAGTFMGSLALLARELGHTVTGSDQNVYPPMSDLLAEQGIAFGGYDERALQPPPDCVVVGNTLKRGVPVVEYVLNARLRYLSGPQWLGENVLHTRKVLAVAGTHGKTTTTAMLAWILDQAGLEPGFLIGGAPLDFPLSARLGRGEWFVIEADEYDTAFFDKRAKFLHYRPHIAVWNNLEYDHADIFPNLAAIQQQFHHFARILPSQGRLLIHGQDPALGATLAMGCWTPVETFGAPDADWQTEALEDPGAFRVRWHGQTVGEVAWTLAGAHNQTNALAAIAAAQCAGVEPSQSCAALSRFRGVKRRLEIRGCVRGVTVYDDFAHHPTAIRLTLQGLRQRLQAHGNPEKFRLFAVLEPRSNTMRLGIHRDTLEPALADADRAFMYLPPDLAWQPSGQRIQCFHDHDALLAAILAAVRTGDHVIIMSNGGFNGLHNHLLTELASHH